MSEPETGAFLHRRIQELTDENAKLKAEARDRRIRNKGAQTEIDDLKRQLAEVTTDRDGWKQKAETAPGEWQKKAEDAAAQLKARDIRDRFRPIEGQLGEKITLDQLFKFHGFDPATADPEQLNVEELVKGWREAAPGLFKPEGATPSADPRGSQPGAKPALQPGPGATRGTRDIAATRTTVKASDFADADYVARNWSQLQAASKAGTLEVAAD